MSFDIFFLTCRFGGTPAETPNRFTGKVGSSPPNEPLTAAEVDAVRMVLQAANASGPDAFGCYVLDFEDGGSAEVFADDLSTGCLVAVRGGIGPRLLQFLVDLLRAGNWVMLPTTEPAIAITASPDNVRDLPPDFPRVVICDSAHELRVLLAEGFHAWQRYRDRIVGDEG
jgi:hypothetical protein